MEELEKKLNQLLNIARNNFDGSFESANFWHFRIRAWIFCESILNQNEVINYFEIIENLRDIFDKDPDFGEAIFQ